MDQRDLTRKLRSTLWPMLREEGFEAHTDRVAWRYANEGIDVVQVQAVGADAAACGCTPISFSAVVACAPPFLTRRRSPVGPDGLPRPHYWDCELDLSLEKRLSQPWFVPLGHGVPTAATPSMHAHVEGLAAVVRRDRHDRPDIWFVRDDGSNLDETVADLSEVVATVGLPMLERFHDPCEVMVLARAGSLRMSFDAQYDLDDAVQGCGS